MPFIMLIIVSVIPALLLTIMAGITGLPSKDYQAKMVERAQSAYQQTQALPATVTFLGQQLTVDPTKVDLSSIQSASYADIRNRKASIEQAMANVCVTLYVSCGLHSRLAPVYNAIRYSNLASSYSVTVSPDRNGYLQLNSTITGGGNGYVYYGVWNGAYTIQAGDTLVYSAFIPSGLPQYLVGNLELDFSDATYGRSYGLKDQNNISAAQGNLATYAGQWYYRQINLASVVGKTIQYVDLVNESNNAGVYNGVLYKTIQITNGNTVQLRIWDPSYLWGFMDMKDGQVSTLLTTGTTQATINCSTATETEFNQYGKYLLRNALKTSALPSVTLDGVSRTFYYSKPAGGEGCGFTDTAELR